MMVVIIMVMVIIVVMVIVMVVVIIRVMIATPVAGAAAVLADAVLALGGDAGDVEAVVGAEALGLELVLLAVVVVAAEVDLAGAGEVGDGAADVAAGPGGVVEVEVDGVGAGHHREEGGHGQEGCLEMHDGWGLNDD